MRIFGSKTVLRAIEESDNSMLLELINDPETEVMLGGKSYPVAKHEQKKWFEGQSNNEKILRLIVAEKDSDSPVGTLIFTDIDLSNGTAQLHIKMATESRGKGYARDAINSAVGYAFNEMRLNCLYAEILEHNKVSVKLFETCGFSRDGLLRARVFKGGKYLNLYSYSLVNKQA